MSYFNRIKETEIELPNLCSQGLDGEFKAIAYKGFEFPRGSGKVWKYPRTTRILQDWKPNLITNQGLDHYGGDVNTVLGACHVGTGNAVPSVNDTALQAEVANTGNIGITLTIQSTPPYYGMNEFQHRFNPGFAGGNVNLSELGVSPNGDPNNLGARSLTVDENGIPTTITVLADEYLEVFYRRRNYPGHIVEATGVPTDDTGTVVIEGVSYNYTIRPAAVTNRGSYSVGTGPGWAAGPLYRQNTAIGFGNNIYDSALLYGDDAVLGAVTSWPTATESSANTSQTSLSYTAGTYNRTFGWITGIDRANFTVGIGGIALKTRLGAYQLVFNNPIPKVYGQVFTYYHNFSWNRKNTWV